MAQHKRSGTRTKILPASEQDPDTVRYTSTSGKKRKPARRKIADTRQAVAKSAPPHGRRSSVLPDLPPAGMCPLRVKGYLATATLHRDRIDISRTIVGRMNGNRSASILWQVVAIGFLDPTRLKNGHIHLATAVDSCRLSATGGGDRMSVAARNPHAIMGKR